MIYTKRTGERVTRVAWHEPRSGLLGVYIACEDGGRRFSACYSYDLIATGGTGEILAAAEELVSPDMDTLHGYTF